MIRLKSSARAQAKARAAATCGRDRQARPALLSGGCADGLGCRIRRAAAAQRCDRGALSAIWSAGFALAAGSARRRRRNSPKSRHAVPMLSLGNAFADEDVADFVGARAPLPAACRRTTPVAFTAEPKIDGLSARCAMRMARSCTRRTRGDGFEGRGRHRQCRAPSATSPKGSRRRVRRTSSRCAARST